MLRRPQSHGGQGRLARRFWGLAAGLFWALVLIWGPAGCGVKARPRLPEIPPPAAVQDLHGQIEGSEAVLQWSAASVKGEDRSPAAGYYIYQSGHKADEAPCEGCPVQFAKVGQVTVADADAAETLLTYRVKVAPQFTYVFKVVGYDRQGQTGPDSNLIEVSTTGTP
jgi:hypothetical protein